MRAFLLLLACGLLGAQSPTAEPITLYAEFEDPGSGASFEEMRSELAGIMGPLGYQFDWRPLRAARGDEASAQLVVVSFKGRCVARDVFPKAARDPDALGWTHISDGKILPFTDVECDRILRFIQPAVAGTSRPERERLFGRAMGRVLAHELYHILTHSTRHASLGIAKAFYTAADLVSTNFYFEAKEARELRSHLRPTPPIEQITAGAARSESPRYCVASSFLCNVR